MVYSFLKFLPEGKTVSKEKNRKYNSRERERERNLPSGYTVSLSLFPKRRQSQRQTERQRERERETGRDSELKKIISFISRFQSRSELQPWKQFTTQTEEETQQIADMKRTQQLFNASTTNNTYATTKTFTLLLSHASVFSQRSTTLTP